MIIEDWCDKAGGAKIRRATRAKLTSAASDIFIFFIFVAQPPFRNCRFRNFVDNQALTFNRMVDCITDENSTFIHEGRSLLIEEFGKDYHIYFSILAAISQGNNSRSQMENIITRLRPIFSKSETKNIKLVAIGIRKGKTKLISLH